MSSQPLIEVADLAKTFRVLRKKTGFLGGLRTLVAPQGTVLIGLSRTP